MEVDTQGDVLNFDAMFLGYENLPGGAHLATAADVAAERLELEDSPLIISNESEVFCKLIVMHGFMPSDAYSQAFSTRGPDNELVTPDTPAYQARVLLRQPEVKGRIEEIRNEVVQWGKTSVEEVEANYRRIALDPGAKHSDRIAATKALCALRGFDAQPDMVPGMTINISLPFQPQQLGHHRIIEAEE